MNSSNPHGSGNVDPLVSGGIIVLILAGVLWQIGRVAFEHPGKASLLGKVLAQPWYFLQSQGVVGGNLEAGVFFVDAVGIGLAAGVIVALAVGVFLGLRRLFRSGNKNEC